MEITPELAGSNLNRALARIQLRDEVPRSLIRFWFDSRLFQDQAKLATSSDSAQATLGLGDLKNFVVGISLDSDTWNPLAAKLEGRHALINQAKHGLVSQLGLLMEYRQSLISAAVSGAINSRETAA